MKPETNPLACFVIDQLGGTGAVAGVCKVSAASVSQWRTRGLPDAREQFLRLRNPEVFRLFDDDNAWNQVVQAREVGRTKEEESSG